MGKKVFDIKRHGKVFWLELSDSHQLGFHFGMTGELKIKGKELIEYKNSNTKGDKTWPPRWNKIIIYFSNDDSIIKNIDKWNKFDSEDEEKEIIKTLDNTKKVDCICFSDARRLGRIWLSKDIMNETPLSKHGFDVMNELPPLEEFKEKLKARNCGIKKLLLDQTFSAGIGNWVADEVLYHAKIHPSTHVKLLDDDDIERMYNSIKEVVSFAVKVNADSNQFPKDWIFHYRWNKGSKKDVSIPGVGNIEYITIGGRTAAFVPTLQKLKSSDKKELTKSEVKIKNSVNGTKRKLSIKEKNNDKKEENVRKKVKKGGKSDIKEKEINESENEVDAEKEIKEDNINSDKEKQINEDKKEGDETSGRVIRRSKRLLIKKEENKEEELKKLKKEKTENTSTRNIKNIKKETERRTKSRISNNNKSKNKETIEIMDVDERQGKIKNESDDDIEIIKMHKKVEVIEVEDGEDDEAKKLPNQDIIKIDLENENKKEESNSRKGNKMIKKDQRTKRDKKLLNEKEKEDIKEEQEEQGKKLEEKKKEKENTEEIKKEQGRRRSRRLLNVKEKEDTKDVKKADKKITTSKEKENVVVEEKGRRRSKRLISIEKEKNEIKNKKCKKVRK